MIAVDAGDRRQRSGDATLCSACQMDDRLKARRKAEKLAEKAKRRDEIESVWSAARPS
jgi:hypothetical protein